MNNLLKKWISPCLLWMLLLTSTLTYSADQQLPLNLQKKILMGQGKQIVPELKKLASQHNSEAAYQLALIYLRSPQKKQKMNDILYLLRSSAKAGHIKANYLLGSMYFSGKDIDKDITSAKFYLFSAAQKGHALAKKLLAKLDEKEQIVRMSKSKAQKMLEYAVISGDIQKASNAIKNGASIKSNQSLLISAITAEKEAMALWLVKRGSSLSVKTKGDDSVLHLAIENNLNKLSHFLIKRNIAINSKNKLGITPVMVAIKKHNDELVKELIEHHANLKITDKNGISSFELAKNIGDKKINNLLSRYQGDKNSEKSIIQKISLLKKQISDSKSLYYQWPLMASAISQKEFNVARYLLKQNQNPWQSTTDGNNAVSLAIESKNQDLAVEMITLFPLNNVQRKNSAKKLLQLAAKNNKVNIVNLLLRNHEIPYNYTDIHQSPLWVSIENHNQEVALKFIQLTKPDFRADSSGLNALLFASKNGLTQVALALISKGFDVNGTDNNQRTPLWYAADAGNNTLAELLLNKGAIVDKVDGRLQTPLCRAIVHGNLKVVKALIHQRANLSIKSENGNTPLMFAAARAPEILKLLIKRGVDVSQRNHSSETALMIAVKNQCEACVQILMENGANPNRKNSNGINSFELAQNNHKILKLLGE